MCFFRASNTFAKQGGWMKPQVQLQDWKLGILSIVGRGGREGVGLLIWTEPGIQNGKYGSKSAQKGNATTRVHLFVYCFNSAKHYKTHRRKAISNLTDNSCFWNLVHFFPDLYLCLDNIALCKHTSFFNQKVSDHSLPVGLHWAYYQVRIQRFT